MPRRWVWRLRWLRECCTGSRPMTLSGCRLLQPLALLRAASAQCVQQLCLQHCTWHGVRSCAASALSSLCLLSAICLALSAPRLWSCRPSWEACSAWRRHRQRRAERMCAATTVRDLISLAALRVLRI